MMAKGEYKSREELLEEITELKKKVKMLESAVSTRSSDSSEHVHPRNAGYRQNPPSTWQLPGYWH